jgi:hypothetical protein
MLVAERKKSKRELAKNLISYLEGYVLWNIEPDVKFVGVNLYRWYRFFRKRLPQKREIEEIRTFSSPSETLKTVLEFAFYKLCQEFPELKEYRIPRRDESFNSEYRKRIRNLIVDVAEETGILEEYRIFPSLLNKAGRCKLGTVLLILRDLSKKKECQGGYYSFTVEEVYPVFSECFGALVTILRTQIRSLRDLRKISADLTHDLDNIFVPCKQTRRYSKEEKVGR